MAATRKPKQRQAITFDNALEGYWLARSSNFSKGTISDYTVTFRRFSERYGATALVDITPADVQRWMADIVDEYNLSKKSLCNVWTALSSFWTWASGELDVPHVIRDHVQKPKYRAPVIEIYSELEIKSMLGACAQKAEWRTRRDRSVREASVFNLRDQAIIITLVDTGVRAAELCNFEIRDYIQSQGRLLVRKGKWNKDRVVFLGQSGRRILWRYLVTRPDAQPTDPLFATGTNRPIERNNLRSTLQDIGARAAVLKVTVHRFRHTFAVNFLRNGGNLLELQEMLGHENMNTLRIYARLAEVDLVAAQRRSSVADKWRL
jgi:integrase/recombinase XerD